MRVSGSLLLLAVALATALAGCRRAAPPFVAVASMVPPAGWTVAKDGESGIVIALPPGWRLGMPGGATPRPEGVPASASVVGVRSDEPGMEALEPPALGQAGSDYAAHREAFAKYLVARERARLVDLRRKGVMLQAVDDARAIIAEAPTRFSIQEIREAGNLDSLKAREKGSHANLGAGEAANLPVGPAWMYRDTRQNRIGDVVCRITYLVCDGETGYALRFVSTNNPKVFDTFHRQVAKSLRKAKP